MAEPENRKETGGNRDKTGRFTKGKSGNPGGRPKKPEVIEGNMKALEMSLKEVQG